MPRIADFRELHVYRGAFGAAMQVFRVSQGFPDDERFGLTSQIRRSSRSVATNTAEAWRKRRYPAAFVAKLSDAEAEAAETRAHLDFALACGYIDRPTYLRLDREYDRLTRQIVRMMESPERWTPGRASGRIAGAARVSPTSPSPGARREKPDDRASNPESPANHPHVTRKKPGNTRSPGREAPR